MHMTYVPQNPFDRVRTLRPSSHLEHSSASSSFNPQRLDPAEYHSTRQHYPLNIWNFRDDHNSRLASLNYNGKGTVISEFQKKMILNTSATSARKQYESHQNKAKYQVLEKNPFYRKNLLVSREQVEEAIAKDLNSFHYQQFCENQSKIYGYQTPKSFTSISQSMKYSNNKIASSSNIPRNQWAPPQPQTNHQPIQYRDSFHYQSTRREEDSLPKKPSASQNQELMKNKSRREEDNEYRESFRKHNEYKQEIVVRGEKYFRVKVFQGNR